MKTIPMPKLHRQDGAQDCGPAAAMMLLEASGKDLTGASQAGWRQVSAAGDCPIDAGGSGWASPPGGLTELVRTESTQLDPECYRIVAASTPEHMVDLICDQIDRALADPVCHGLDPNSKACARARAALAPIVLGNGKNHWMVINGYRSHAGRVHGFRVLDPGQFGPIFDGVLWPGASYAHHPDDACGTGLHQELSGIGTVQVRDWGTPFHIICSQWWQRRTMTGFATDAGQRWVAIARAAAPEPDRCSPWGPPLSAQAWQMAPVATAAGAAQLSPCWNSVTTRAEAITCATACVDLAMAALAAFPFASDDPWPALLANPGLVRNEPVPVKNIGGSTYWYIVQTFSLDNQVPMAITVDRRTGALLELWALPGGSVALPPADLWEAILGIRAVVSGENRDQRLLVEAWSRDEVDLVWAPVQESPSPLMPFAVSAVLDDARNRTDRTVFVRADGVAFASLTGLDGQPVPVERERDFDGDDPGA